jgi:hypothetical protein
MPYPLITDFAAPPEAQCKPHVCSFDSGQECSLAHWLEVCRLVELAEKEERKPKRNAFDDSFLPISE